MNIVGQQSTKFELRCSVNGLVEIENSVNVAGNVFLSTELEYFPPFMLEIEAMKDDMVDVFNSFASIAAGWVCVAVDAMLEGV